MDVKPANFPRRCFWYAVKMSEDRPCEVNISFNEAMKDC